MDKRSFSEILIALGEERENYFGAIAPPIIQTSNFAFKTTAEMRESRIKEFERHVYSRGNNPTVNILRKKLAALEKTEDALVFSSGSAAVAASVLSVVKAGDHVICVEKPYHWTQRLMGTILPKFGVEVTFIDGTSIDNYSEALQQNTRLVYLESPNSFTYELQDLHAVSDFCKANKLVSIIDNSYASPIYQNPIDFEIDVIVHSASKYLGGHSDIVAGVICASRERVASIFDSEFMTLGSKLGPFEAWLMLRGLRTLEIRLERSSQTAEKVINWLEGRPEIERVLYPFNSAHPQTELARKQMRGCGGLFTIALNTELVKNAEEFCDALNHFLLGVSWGGHESLIFPAAAAVDHPNFQDPGMNLVRMYCGLEDADYLIEDIKSALEKTSET